MGIRTWCAWFLVASSVGVAARQAQRPQPSFKSGTQLVSIFATVVDADKRLVPNLTQDDFEILDNDKPQAITFFNNEIQPITVVVMIVTRARMTGSNELLRKAIKQFVQSLPSGVQGGVW